MTTHHINEPTTINYYIHEYNAPFEAEMSMTSALHRQLLLMAPFNQPGRPRRLFWLYSGTRVKGYTRPIHTRLFIAVITRDLWRLAVGVVVCWKMFLLLVWRLLLIRDDLFLETKSVISRLRTRGGYLFKGTNSGIKICKNVVFFFLKEPSLPINNRTVGRFYESK